MDGWHDPIATTNPGGAGGGPHERPLRRPLSESHLRTLLAAAIGAVLAGLYAQFVGCRTGTCLITSSVWTAALYGGVVGAVAGWPARPRRQPAPERSLTSPSASAASRRP